MSAATSSWTSSESISERAILQGAKSGIDEPAVRRQLLSQYNLEIGAGLGALAREVWRIGLMGYSSRAENIQLLLGALRAVLNAGSRRPG